MKREDKRPSYNTTSEQRSTNAMKVLVYFSL